MMLSGRKLRGTSDEKDELCGQGKRKVLCVLAVQQGGLDTDGEISGKGEGDQKKRKDCLSLFFKK